MIDYIIANKEWLFSGIGIPVVGIAWTIWTKLRKSNNAESYPITKPAVEEDIETEEHASVSKTPETESERIAKRFQRILRLMNEGRQYERFTISKLAEIMRLERTGDLECYFLGVKEPTFRFIESFCDTFGVHADWLKSGRGHPFSNSDQRLSDPLWYYGEIIDSNPEEVHFVRENSDTAQAFIVLKYSNWRYKVLQRSWHISGHVGAGGQSQLYSFYKLIKKLKCKEDFSVSCWGATLNTLEFNELMSGDAFPAKYLDCGRTEDPWWDDLTDVYHGYPIAEDYERMHGKSFIKAQEIIRYKIESQGQKVL